MKSITNALPKIGNEGGGTILPEEIIEIKKFESTTDSNGKLIIQFDNGASVSDDNIYAIALIELGGEENNLISDRVLIGNTSEVFNFYSSVSSTIIDAGTSTTNGKINIDINYLNGNTTYKYIGFLVKTNQ